MFLPHEDQREPRHLDLGCGIKPRNPYKCPSLYGIDLRPLQVPGVKESRQADLLTGQIPYDSDFFDSVSAYDFLEHVPRVALTGSSTRFPFVDLMNEIWRVLRYRGLF